MNSRLYIAFLIACFSAAAMLAQTAESPQPQTFLRTQLAATPVELGALEKGQIIVRLPSTTETREVAAFAIMRLDVPAEFFVEKVHDIVSFKKSDNVLQIGKFSDPPRLEDLAGLTFEPAEIDAIKRCKVNRCEIKMSAAAIERFRKEVNWALPSYRERATALWRQILLDYVQAYLQEGNAALGEYNDKSYSVRLPKEFESLLLPAPYMYGYVPEFQKYLQEFPKNRPPGTADFIYWSKEKFGLKPVVSVTHITIYKQPRPSGMDVLIASKGIYANHYFEASLGLTGFIHSPSEPARSYLIYINRSRTDALRGLFAGLKRTLISGSLRDGAKKNMELIKEKLETDYGKLDIQNRKAYVGSH
jgi:hypothetical protein